MADDQKGKGLGALNWLNFFAADVSTGVGPFLAVYLTSNLHWNAAQIGIALSAMSFSSVLAQAPAGYIIGRTAHKRATIISACIVMGVMSFSIPFFSNFTYIIIAQVLMGFAGAFYIPTLIALAVSMAKKETFDGIISKNQSYNHAGNVAAAIFIGVVGRFTNNEGIFYCLATLAILCTITALAIPKDQVDKSEHKSGDAGNRKSIKEILGNRQILIFLFVTFGFHLANGAMLPLVGQEVSKGKSADSSLYLSACVVVAQLVMVPVCYLCGKYVDRGRKWLLIIAYMVLPVRGMMYIPSSNPYYFISIQVLDGVAAGIFGVVSILVMADLMGKSNKASFSQGLLVTAAGLGSSVSNVAAGFIVDAVGFKTGFIVLSAFAAAALLLLWLAVPETLPGRSKKTSFRPLFAT